MFSASVRLDLPGPRWQAERRHRPSVPQVSRFPEFVVEGMVLAIFAVGGRLALRLRLSPPSRSEGQPILLGLQRGRQDRQTMREPEVDPRHSAIDEA
jgi:hypothetical protein